VSALDAAVRAGSPDHDHADPGSPAADAAVELLRRELGAFLEEHHFLQLRVEPEALCFEGHPVLRPPCILPPLLHAGDVVELLFKVGVEPDELARFVTCLQKAPFGVDGADSVATRLWECDLRHIAFRCLDDLVFSGTEASDSFDLANSPVDRVDELMADASSDPAYAASAILPEIPLLDLDQLPPGFRRVLQDTEADAAALRALAPFGPDGALARIVLLLSGVLVAEPDAEARTLAAQVLARLIGRELETGRFDSVHDLLVGLEAAAPAGSRAAMQLLCDTLCAEPLLVQLGAGLESEATPGLQSHAAHEIATWLADRDLDRLWAAYTGMHELGARDRAGVVVAAACAANPRALVDRVRGKSWSEARDAVGILARIGGGRVLPLLGRWRNHDDARVRTEVVRALASLPEHAATAILGEMLCDPERRVRQSALWALAGRGDPRALADMRFVLMEERTFRELGSDERDDFFRAYGRLADEDTVIELAGLLQQQGLRGRGWKAELRRGAAIALGESHWPGANALLQQHATARDGRLREACRQALRALQDRLHLERVAAAAPAPGASRATPDSGGPEQARSPSTLDGPLPLDAPGAVNAPEALNTPEADALNTADALDVRGPNALDAVKAPDPLGEHARDASEVLDTPNALDALEVLAPANAHGLDVPDQSNAFQVVDVFDVPDAPDPSDASRVADVFDVPDALNAHEASDSQEASHPQETPDPHEAPDWPPAREVKDAD
jgi:hypothetical protein